MTTWEKISKTNYINNTIQQKMDKDFGKIIHKKKKLSKIVSFNKGKKEERKQGR